jgi:hypothetical protein
MNFITLQFKKYTKLGLIIGALLLSVSCLPTSVSADTLNVSCSSNPSTPYTGDNVSYYATVSGGNGNYSYSWSGTDNVIGYGSVLTHSYYSLGQQSATVTVNSNGITQSATCYVNVVQRTYNNGNNWNNSNYGRLGATCLAIPTSVNTGDNVNWMIQNLTGGNGSYTYSWSGTDGLTGSGQTAYKTYSYTGSKSASVNISSSDGQYLTVNCSPIYVGGTSYGNNWNNNNGSYNYNGSLGVSCYGTPSQANMFDSVTWYANVTGGNGYYTYTWNGTDALYGSGQNISKMYPSVGYKTASVTVTSNGQSVTNSCAINVGSTYSYNNPTYYYPPTTTYTYPQTSFVQTPATTYYQPTVYSSYGNSNPVSGVFLSQLPATGINFSLKMILFTLGLALWSLFAAYLFVQKKNKKVVLAGLNQAERIEAFKRANQLKKGIN